MKKRDFRPSPAMVVACVALFVALGGTALAASYVVSSNSQIGPDTVSGHKPPAAKHSNLIAGSVNGQDVADNSLGGADVNESSLTGDAHKLIYSAPLTTYATLTPIATVGPYTIKAACYGTFYTMILETWVKGPAGTVNDLGSTMRNDTEDNGTYSHGLQIPANTDLKVNSVITGSGDFDRLAGTMMLKTGSELVQVDYHGVADSRNGGSCFLYGTGTRAT
jgi:hypothetical protein